MGYTQQQLQRSEWMKHLVMEHENLQAEIYKGIGYEAGNKTQEHSKKCTQKLPSLKFMLKAMELPSSQDTALRSGLCNTGAVKHIQVSPCGGQGHHCQISHRVPFQELLWQGEPRLELNPGQAVCSTKPAEPSVDKV